jgi:hypothetical protein
MSATAHPDNSRGRHSHTGPPWRSQPRSAHSGPDPSGGTCHTNFPARQNDKSPCSLTFTLPPTDRSVPGRLYWRWVVGLAGRRPESLTCGLELATEHEKWELLRDYADENSYLIFGRDSPTTIPYNPSATHDVLNIEITRHFPSSVHLTSCPALSSNHLLLLIDTMCRSSFQHTQDHPDFGRTDWAKFQATWKAKFRST